MCRVAGFNEAAGFTQRKPGKVPKEVDHRDMASMRPPVLPSGNSHSSTALPAGPTEGFNEAAGFTQRKRSHFCKE